LSFLLVADREVCDHILEIQGEESMPTTPLRTIKITLQVTPFTEVLTGPDGEEQTLDGVQHVSVFKPFNQPNGGPDTAHLYRIRATNALTNQPVDLQHMRFGGIAPHTGAARFADQ
jgi:hypothetical protein